MIPRHDAKRKAKGKFCSRLQNSKPAESGYQSRTDAALKRERLDKLIAEIRVNKPFWADKPPWIAERFIEHGAILRTQSLLPFGEGGAE